MSPSASSPGARGFLASDVVATLILIMSLAAAGTADQVQTIELPALDRSRVAFRLDAQPMRVLGPSQLPGGYFRIPNRVFRLSDGRVVVASFFGFSRLHVVRPDGSHTAIGDFNTRMGSLRGVCRTPDDRLLVHHDETRITVFDPDGAIVRAGVHTEAGVVLCPWNGRSAWVRLPGTSRFGPSEEPHPPGTDPRRQNARLQHLEFGSVPRAVADLGEVDSTDSYPIGPVPRVQGRTRPPLYSWYPRPFGRDLAVAVDGARVHTGDGTTWEVRTWDETGRLVRMLRVAGPLDPVTPELRAAFLDEHYAGNSDEYRQRTIEQFRLLDESVYPSHLPVFSALKIDRAGRLWVRRYPRPLESIQEWWVFSPDARYLGRVEMPAALIVEDIGPDYVAGSYLVRRAARPETDVLMDRSEYDVRFYRILPG